MTWILLIVGGLLACEYVLMGAAFYIGMMKPIEPPGVLGQHIRLTLICIIWPVIFVCPRACARFVVWPRRRFILLCRQSPVLVHAPPGMADRLSKA